MNLTYDHEKLASVFRAHPEVVAAYLFGSALAGRLRPESDVDVAVLLKPEACQRALDLQLNMMADLETVFGREADVVILNDAPLILVRQVLRGKSLLYGQESGFRIAFEARKMQEYFDFKPYLEAHSRAFRERLAQGGPLGSAGSGRIKT